jgi:hypothetical protein
VPDLFPRFAKASIDGDDLAPSTIPRPVADRRVGSSLLRKAMRRGDVGRAKRAAIPLYTLQGRGNWRAHGGKVLDGILKNRERALMEIIAAAEKGMPRSSASSTTQTRSGSPARRLGISPPCRTRSLGTSR